MVRHKTRHMKTSLSIHHLPFKIYFTQLNIVDMCDVIFFFNLWFLMQMMQVSDAFDGHVCALSDTNQEISEDQLFSYFKQLTLGLQELHKHNIVHCDLRCSHIYVNPDEVIFFYLLYHILRPITFIFFCC